VVEQRFRNPNCVVSHCSPLFLDGLVDWNRIADDYGKEVIAELRKSRRQDKEMERLKAEVLRLSEREAAG